jgi:hypothetical protein
MTAWALVDDAGKILATRVGGALQKRRTEALPTIR